MQNPVQLVGGPDDGMLVALRGIACEIPHVDLETGIITVHRWGYQQRGEGFVGVYEGVVKEFPR